MLLRLSGVTVPKRQSPSFGRAGVTAAAGHRGTWGEAQAWPPCAHPPQGAWLHFDRLWLL